MQINMENMKTELAKAKEGLSQTSANLESARASLVSMTAQRDAATSANNAARGEIRRLVAAIQAILPDAGNLANSVSTIPNLVTQSCSGGSHGVDFMNAPQIRSIVDGARRITSAQTAITNIVTSVPLELRN